MKNFSPFLFFCFFVLFVFKTRSHCDYLGWSWTPELKCSSCLNLLSSKDPRHRQLYLVTSNLFFSHAGSWTQGVTHARRVLKPWTNLCHPCIIPTLWQCRMAQKTFSQKHLPSQEPSWARFIVLGCPLLGSLNISQNICYKHLNPVPCTC